MKRTLSSILALTLGLGAVPAQAQTALGRVSLTAPLSAPTPVPGGIAPILGTLTPTLAVPALTVALTPAAFAPLGIDPLQKPAAASPLQAIPATVLPVSAIPVAPLLPPSRTPPASPMDSLRALAAPDALARTVSHFDGAASKPDEDAEPIPARSDSAQPALDKPSAPEPGKPEKKDPHPLYSIGGRGLMVGTAIAAAAPILWDAAPSLHFIFTYIAASVLMLAIAVPVEIGVRVWRRAHRSSQDKAQPPPTWRKKLGALAIGAALGLAIGAAPTVYQAPLTDQVHAWQDSRLAPDKRTEAHRLVGGAAEAETIALLSQNPVGRDVLNHLRDRGGVLRMPMFFVSKQPDSYAEHEDLFDGVYLAADQITERGWTVDQFLKDPSLQRQLIRDMQSTVLHELVHAVQGRRAPWTPGYFQMPVEHEYESNIRQHYYIHERLKADPSVDLTRFTHDLDVYVDMADSLDVYLSDLDSVYVKDVHVSSPVFDALLAKTRAAWPAHRVEVYLIMAERATRANQAGSAKMYMQKAKDAAKEAGLPEPTALVASR